MVQTKNCCVHPECDLTASFGFADESKRKVDGRKRREFCSKHRLDGQSHHGQICKDTFCSTRASYGFPGEVREYCGKHKMEGMAIPQARQCEASGCMKMGQYAKKMCPAHKPRARTSTNSSMNEDQPSNDGDDDSDDSASDDEFRPAGRAVSGFGLSPMRKHTHQHSPRYDAKLPFPVKLH
jgi:hypothetical protein